MDHCTDAQAGPEAERLIEGASSIESASEGSPKNTKVLLSGMATDCADASSRPGPRRSAEGKPFRA